MVIQVSRPIPVVKRLTDLSSDSFEVNVPEGVKPGGYEYRESHSAGAVTL